MPMKTSAKKDEERRENKNKQISNRSRFLHAAPEIRRKNSFELLESLVMIC
jgi:hypothetical protein